MNRTCECGMFLEPGARGRRCQECGARGCPSCAIEIAARTYCRWCGLATVPEAA